MPLQTKYPWTQTPFLANAPMGGFAGGALAAEVTKAGGLGFIGAVNDMAALTAHLDEARARLLLHSSSHPSEGPLHTSSIPLDPLPIGIGFLPFITPLDPAVAIVASHRPAAVWLFAAPSTSVYETWTTALRAAHPAVQIWIQTGGVAAALELAVSPCRPDVLVLQGTDAGGHGLVKGAGVVALVPEAVDALRAAGRGDVAVVAAGGVADGRGVVAALALGAQGVVMGTRFLGAEEVVVPAPGYKDAVVRAWDGGQSTVRGTLFDEVGPRGNPWPVAYDGRGLRNVSLEDAEAGMAIEENRRLLSEAVVLEDKGFGAGGVRATVWAGTAVGLVRDVRPAGDIVRNTLSEARAVLKGFKALL